LLALRLIGPFRLSGERATVGCEAEWMEDSVPSSLGLAFLREGAH